MTQSNVTYALDASHYTDPNVLQHERRSILSNTWQFAGHKSDLKGPGDYFQFQIAGQDLFCIYDDSDRISAYYSHCQTSGKSLVIHSNSPTEIICPVHNTKFVACKANLDTRNSLSTSNSNCCTKHVLLEHFHNFIFANLDLNASSMDQWFPKVRQELLEFVPQINELKPYRPYNWTERCNWKVAIENYSECYHCRFNHKAISDGMIATDTYDIQPQGYCLKHTSECQNLDQMNYSVDLSLETSSKYSSWFLWPLFTFQVFPGNILNTYCWRELDSNHVEVLRSWYTVDGLQSGLIDKLAKFDYETTVVEDIRLVESVQRGLHSRGYRPGPLVLDPKHGINSEHSIQILQEWMKVTQIQM